MCNSEVQSRILVQISVKVNHTFCKMQNKRSSGSDGTDIQIMRLCCPVITSYLTIVINRYVAEGKTSDGWQIGEVISMRRSYKSIKSETKINNQLLLLQNFQETDKTMSIFFYRKVGKPHGRSIRFQYKTKHPRRKAYCVNCTGRNQRNSWK